MKWVARGYAQTYGGVWAKGDSRKEAINEVVGQRVKLSALDLYKYPEETEIEIFSDGTIHFQGIDDEEIGEIEVDDKEVNEINERIKGVIK